VTLPDFGELQADLDRQREQLADLARREVETMRMIDSILEEKHMQCEMCGTKHNVTEDEDDGCRLCDRCRWIDEHPLSCPECGEAKECKADEYCRICERCFE
jgi:phage/plasmid primase-like uncharacterized protein